MPALSERERELIAITIEKIELAVRRSANIPSGEHTELASELVRMAKETRDARS